MKSTKSGLTTYILSLPPLGLLGLHRFYTGNIGTGLLMLLTGGGFLVGAIYDFIQITNNKFTDGKNNEVEFLNKHGRWKSSAIFATAMFFLLSAFIPSIFIAHPIVVVAADICGLIAVSLTSLSIWRYVSDNIFGGLFNGSPSTTPLIVTTPEVAPPHHRPALSIVPPRAHSAPLPPVHGGHPHPVKGASPISQPTMARHHSADKLPAPSLHQEATGLRKRH